MKLRVAPLVAPVIAPLSMLWLVALCLGTAHADTRDSNYNDTIREQKASPATPGRQQEEQTEAFGQPDSPHPGGTSPRTTVPYKKGDAAAGTGSGADSSRDTAAGAAGGADSSRGAGKRPEKSR